MNTDPEPVGLRLSATDAERCDRLREVDALIAALAPDAPERGELQAERIAIQQDLIWSKRSKAK